MGAQMTLQIAIVSKAQFTFEGGCHPSLARGSIVCVISLLMLSKCRRGYIIANVEILKVFFGVTLSFFAPMLIQYAILLLRRPVGAYLFFVHSPFCEEVLSTSIWRVSLWRV